MESVANGLDDLPDEAAIVLVHDAARPLVGDETIDRVITSVREGRCAIAALPVVDTLKEVAEDGTIVRTVDRERLWRAQTPQGFPRGVIVDVHRRARADRVAATDDAALCERYGVPVRVVRGSERALKVTDSGDFQYYAGPVRAKAAGVCVKWGGAIQDAAYDSPFEHCG